MEKESSLEEGTELTVFDYITQEETAFKTAGVPIVDGWDFEMHNHIRRTVLYKYGQLETGKTDDKPVENIILPILNVAYRSEDIDVKDIIPYVDDKNNTHKSLLVKKFHDRWARREELDTFIDAVNASRIDFGLGLVKFVGGKPELVPLQRLAFCDQTDILSGPICEKHMYSPDQLMEMAGRWDKDKIEEVITMSRSEKANTQVEGQKAKTPGRYIEVYELHAMCPESWDPKVNDGDPNKWTRQFHVVCYYQGEQDERNGIALFQGTEKESIYDAIKRDEIYGRACGYGGAEELFEPQVWNTYSRIQMKEMLDVASLMIVKTTDAGLAKRQKITDLEKGEILEVEDGKDASQLVLQPINWGVFDKWQDDMKLNARTIGSANDPQLGVQPPSGTAMGLQKVVLAQGQGIHEHRRGIFATFLAKLYKNWFLKNLVDEMNKGDEWIDELSLDEMQWVAEKATKNAGEKRKKKLFLEGKGVDQLQIDEYKENFKEEWLGGGNEKFITIIKDEFKDIPIDVKVNIAGKQKDLANMTEKIVSFMRAIVSTPQMLTIPGMADLLNQVVEYSGLDPVDFSGLKPEQLVPAQPEQAPAQAQAPAPIAQ